MKKIVFLLTLFLNSFFLSAKGTGFSLHFSSGTDFVKTENIISGASFSFETDRIPLQMNFENLYDFKNELFCFGIKSDFLFISKELSDFSKFQTGFGAGSGIEFSGSDFYFNEAFRLPLEVNRTDFDGFMEIFLKAAFQYEIVFNSDTFKNVFSVPVDFGLLFWY